MTAVHVFNFQILLCIVSEEHTLCSPRMHYDEFLGTIFQIEKNLTKIQRVARSNCI